MKSKVIMGIVLTVLLIGMLTLAFNIQPIKAGGTIYIRADGSIDPDTAPILSVDNITYTFTDNIYDSIVVERDNIVVDGAGYTLQGIGSGTGISIWGRGNVTIRNMEIKAFGDGIWLESSLNITISGNNITNNNYHGIWLSNSSNNHISINNIATNNEIGIWLNWTSSFNIVSENNITNNDWAGILFLDAWNNTIFGNNIVNNNYGIELYSLSSNNTIYHNNFINNTQQVYIRYSGYTNFWDDGYPSGGNYWSDYNGTDANGDGIGDTPYEIDANNTDRYPLMEPWTPLQLIPVGGIYIPVNKLELLAPYIGLTILLAVAVTTVVYVKKRKRDTGINC